MSKPNDGPTAAPAKNGAEVLLKQAKRGATNCLGELLELHRNYLRVLASAQIRRKLRPRLCPSDLVQETMLAAYRDFRQFRGTTESQFIAWLRQILIHSMNRVLEKHVFAEKRDVRREVSLDAMTSPTDTSSVLLGPMMSDGGRSPSSVCGRDEELVVVADCMAQLPAPLREVIVLRNFRGCSFEEVAREMERSNGAVRILWLRAVKELQNIYHARGGR